jgi:hypothetical protein
MALFPPTPPPDRDPLEHPLVQLLSDGAALQAAALGLGRLLRVAERREVRRGRCAAAAARTRARRCAALPRAARRALARETDAAAARACYLRVAPRHRPR